MARAPIIGTVLTKYDASIASYGDGYGYGYGYKDGYGYGYGGKPGAAPHAVASGSPGSTADSKPKLEKAPTDA
jgi:hypothetical protein